MGYDGIGLRVTAAMLVFWKQKLVILAVPKTGTTALEAALAPHADAVIRHPPAMKHVTARRYRNMLAKFFEQRGTRPMETMAIIREPRDWLGSWYRYRARPAIIGSDTSTHGKTFDAFVEAWLQSPEPEFARVGRQSRFVSDDAGRVLVDHLFPYENLTHATRFLEERLDLSLDLPVRNVSPKDTLDLSPAMDARLKAEAAADFALWQDVTGRFG